METILFDLRFAIRTLLKSRGFAGVAVLTLALGIGATTAMFSVIYAVILRPLPFKDPQRLVAIGVYDTRRTIPDIPRGNMSFPDFSDIRTRNHSFEEVADFSYGGYTMTGAGDAVRVQASQVTVNLFPMLGVQPVLGRSFSSDEDGPGHHVLVLSDRFWRTHMHADPGAIGRSVALNGRQFTIVGVMPAGFQFPIRGEARDIWVTFSSWAETDDPKDQPNTAQRGNHSTETIARLKPGVTVQQANADLASIAHALSQEFPNENTYAGFGATPELDFLVGKKKTPLLVLFGAVAMVLLIACANVANLLLARSSSRAREIAIRASLGASRLRIVRQLVTESVVLSVAGAAGGMVIAIWALSGVLRLYPENLPRVEQISIDPIVLLFTASLALGTGLLFGLLPALRVSSPDLTLAMREGGRTTAGTADTRLRSGLVVGEIAIGVTLLIGAGLLIRSLQRLSHADLGFNPEHLLTASFDLSETRYNPDTMTQFINGLMEKLRALPGVVNAAGSLPLPLDNDTWSVGFNRVDRPLPPAMHHSAGFFVAQPGFFETTQMPLVRGRTFDQRDQRNSAPVMIINQSFAKQFYAGEDPIGKMITIGASEGGAREKYATREIIGVVGDVRTGNLTQAPMPAYYIPLPQLMWGAPSLIIRTAGEPTSLVSAVRRTLADMDPQAPLFQIKTMEDYLALDLGAARFQATLLSIFAGIALLLTAVGLYGVMAYSVVQRTHEIGVRMALGASRTNVLQLMLRRGAMMTAMGLAVGVGAALALAKLIESLLYEIPPRDPATYVIVCLTLSVVALLASYIPALRASRVDPIVALRYE